MFNTAHAFNGDISEWDVSNVVNMEAMFKDAKAFNRDISKWEVDKVTTMHAMFSGAQSFTQTLCESWKTSTASKVNMFGDSPGKICD